MTISSHPQKAAKSRHRNFLPACLPFIISLPFSSHLSFVCCFQQTHLTPHFLSLSMEGCVLAEFMAEKEIADLKGKQ